MFSQISNLLKLRIGVIMMFTALAAMVVTPGQQLDAFQILILAFAVLISAGSAGAFNQYFEVDLDRDDVTADRFFVAGVIDRGKTDELLEGRNPEPEVFPEA